MESDRPSSGGRGSGTEPRETMEELRARVAALPDAFAHVPQAEMRRAREEFREIGEVAGKPTARSAAVADTFAAELPRRRFSMDPRLRLLREAWELSAAMLQPIDPETWSPGAAAAERERAGGILGSLLEELRAVRLERSQLLAEQSSYRQSLPLMRFTAASGETREEMLAAAREQRLSSEGEMVLAWVNRSDLETMKAYSQATDHGDGRKILKIWDDDAVFGHLVTYDEDLNDPPPELGREVADWLAEHQPDTSIDYDRHGLAIALNFPDSGALASFREKWGRTPESVIRFPSPEP